MRPHARWTRLGSAALLFGLALVTLQPPAHAGKTKLAVMTIVDGTRRLRARLLDALTDAMRARLAQSGRFIVIDKGRQAEALRKLVRSQKRASYRACYSSKCQIPLGQALAADTILRTKIARVGSAYVVNAELVDLAKEAVTKAAQETVHVGSGRRDDMLLEAIARIADRLTGQSAAGVAAPGVTGAGTADLAPPVAPPADDDAQQRAAAEEEEQRRAAALRQAQAQSAYEAERRAAIDNAQHAEAYDSTRRRKRLTSLIYGWSAIGAGALAAGLGVYWLTAKVAAENDKAELATSPAEIDSAQTAAKKAQTTGFVMLGLAAASAVVGSVLLLSAPSAASATPRGTAGPTLDRLPTAAVTPGGAAIGWGGRF